MALHRFIIEMGGLIVVGNILDVFLKQIKEIKLLIFHFEVQHNSNC